MSELPQNPDDIISRIAGHYREVIRLIGEDPSREGLVDTPERAAKALYYLTRGYRQNISDVIHGALFEAPSSDMVVVRDIEFYSLCEHHILPFFGKVSVGYIPGEKIVGLSKVARVVDVFARRLQVQERFAVDLCETLQPDSRPKGVIVNCRARHLCMQMRGVQKQNSMTVTTSSCGVFTDDCSLREQFFASIQAPADL